MPLAIASAGRAGALALIVLAVAAPGADADARFVARSALVSAAAGDPQVAGDEVVYATQPTETKIEIRAIAPDGAQRVLRTFAAYGFDPFSGGPGGGERVSFVASEGALATLFT